MLLLQNIKNVPVQFSVRAFSTTNCSLAKRWKDKYAKDYESEFSNPVREIAGMKVYPQKGMIAGKAPIKVRVEKYVDYLWCGCGYAKTCQPFCDRSCENLWLKKVIKGGPVRYIAPETKDVWFCNCKQTEHRPFCDGTHRSEEIQGAKADIRTELWEPKE